MARAPAEATRPGRAAAAIKTAKQAARAAQSAAHIAEQELRPPDPDLDPYSPAYADDGLEASPLEAFWESLGAEGSGDYVKVWRESGPGESGGRTFVLQLEEEDLRAAGDSPEAELQRRLAAVGQGTGGYLLMPHRHGLAGFVARPQRVRLVVPDTMLRAHGHLGAAPSTTATSDPLLLISKGIEVAQGAKTPVVDPVQMVNAVIGAADKLAARGGALGEFADLFKPLMPALVARLLDTPKPPDLLATLKQAQDLGLIPKPGEGEERGDMLDRAEDLRALVDLVRPFVSGEKPSVALELARIVGPQVPRMVERITASVDRVVDYKREEMYVRGGRTAPPRRRAVPAAAEPSEAARALVAVLNEAAPAAGRGDEGHFPALADALRTRVAGCAALLDDVRAGRQPAEYALGAMRALGVEVLEPLQGYLRRFLAWYAVAAPPVAATAPPPTPTVGGVVARCERCGAEYSYASRTDLEREQEPCDATVAGGPCGGPIRAMEAAA